MIYLTTPYDKADTQNRRSFCNCYLECYQGVYRDASIDYDNFNSFRNLGSCFLLGCSPGGRCPEE